MLRYAEIVYYIIHNCLIETILNFFNYDFYDNYSHCFQEEYEKREFMKNSYKNACF